LAPGDDGGAGRLRVERDWSGRDRGRRDRLLDERRRSSIGRSPRRAVGSAFATERIPAAERAIAPRVALALRAVARSAASVQQQRSACGVERTAAKAGSVR
jgi:hypothetical protein